MVQEEDKGTFADQVVRAAQEWGQNYWVNTKFAGRSLANAGFDVLTKRSQITWRKVKGYNEQECGSHPEWKGTYANHGIEGRARMGSIRGSILSVRNAP